MSLSTFRQNKLMALIERNGSLCHYCAKTVKLRASSTQHKMDDATLDHKIPKAAGGTNADENLLLACRECNEAKEDRSYDDFLARPWRLYPRKVKHPLRRPRHMPSAGAINATRKIDKAMRGTLAWAIAIGEVTDYGAYKPRPPANQPQPRGRKMTAIELAKWLRETHEKKGRPWPLA